MHLPDSLSMVVYNTTNYCFKKLLGIEPTKTLLAHD